MAALDITAEDRAVLKAQMLANVELLGKDKKASQATLEIGNLALMQLILQYAEGLVRCSQTKAQQVIDEQQKQLNDLSRRADKALKALTAAHRRITELEAKRNDG